ncbi:FAD-binding oxidoreductase [Microlunatus soli]|uniref:Glycolate oxidase FAD binding subunit n=1 Tax=Microlunatus soli TaxID=630515 RepID=A0A1H1XU56_9ACTN|nr:FAD-binding oxidoreductase [Microlunatus soli]SDT12702.1 glycolate oxidase FAD binding subunit [Microlunatus soli]
MTTATSPGRPPAAERQRPDTVEAAARYLRAGAGDRRGVLITGAGTKLGWGGPVTAPMVELDTSRLDQIIDYRPSDMTVAVQAGTPLNTLQGVLAEHGQWLAIDPPTEAAGATVGGLLATGDAGPCRLRYGTLRDLAIGCTVVLADGVVAHAGGHVIKNVAGYDLTKLMHGSLGTLALIGEVVLRLQPVPEATRTISCRLSAVAAVWATLAVIGSGVEPSATEWYGAGSGPGVLLVRLDGTQRSIEPAAAVVLQQLREVNAVDLQILTVDDAVEQWRRAAETTTGGGRCHPAADGAATVRLGTLPDQLPLVVEQLDTLGSRHQVRFELTSSTGIGLHTVRLTGPVASLAALIDDLGAVLQRQLGGTLTLRDRDRDVDQLRGTSAPMPDPPPTAGLQRAVKDHFDPGHRLAPGRFAPWF